MMVGGTLIQAVWLTQWWDFIKLYLPQAIWTALMKFWNRSHMW